MTTRTLVVSLRLVALMLAMPPLLGVMDTWLFVMIGHTSGIVDWGVGADRVAPTIFLGGFSFMAAMVSCFFTDPETKP